jgi:hypothetical protein
MELELAIEFNFAIRWNYLYSGKQCPPQLEDNRPWQAYQIKRQWNNENLLVTTIKTSDLLHCCDKVILSLCSKLQTAFPGIPNAAKRKRNDGMDAPVWSKIQGLFIPTNQIRLKSHNMYF